jgi:hypothetical protein
VKIERGAANESYGFGEKAVPQLQGNPPQGRGARDLQQGSPPQTASGLIARLQKQPISFII